MISKRFVRSTVRWRTAAIVVVLLTGTLLGAPWSVGVAEELPAWSADANASRDAIPAVYKWDLSPMFASDAAWEEARQKFLGRVPELARS